MTGELPDDDFVARGSPGKRLMLLGLSLVFVALGLWMAGLLGVDPGQDIDQPGIVLGVAGTLGVAPATVVHAIGWVCLVFFGFAGLLHARRLFDRAPELCAGPSGIWWRRHSDTRVPWDAIDTAIVKSVFSNKFVCVWLKEPGRYPRRGANLGQGLTRGTNGDISYALQGTDGKLDDLIHTIRRYRPDIRIY
jgi:hypothetical protein